jgi:hypothetical protein
MSRATFVAAVFVLSAALPTACSHAPTSKRGSSAESAAAGPREPVNVEIVVRLEAPEGSGLKSAPGIYWNFWDEATQHFTEVQEAVDLNFPATISKVARLRPGRYGVRVASWMPGYLDGRAEFVVTEKGKTVPSPIVVAYKIDPDPTPIVLMEIIEVGPDKE